MENSNYIWYILDWIIFVLSSLSVLYLFAFAFASIFHCTHNYDKKNKFSKILVLYPAYNENKVIKESISKFSEQDYPRNSYDIIVISDHMTKETNDWLAQQDIILLQPSFPQSSKAKSLKYAMEKADKFKNYEIVIILDADNIVDSDFLSRINMVFPKEKAIQAHRTSKNRNTDTAILDSLSEEINNSIFRKGHVNLGISSALIGSGEAFNYDWFKANVNKLEISGEDKELEALLLKDKIFINYLDDVFVYDEKTQKASGYYKQRRRWLGNQVFCAYKSIKDLPMAIIKWNVGYMDKIIQWLQPPLILLFGGIFIIAVFISFLDFSTSIKWWGLWIVFIFTMIMAIPENLWNKKIIKALLKTPLIFIMMITNLFRLKGTNKKFIIHTEKDYENRY
ncbi:MAG: glycosyltransferase [Bacteroidales bacterium]